MNFCWHWLMLWYLGSMTKMSEVKIKSGNKVQFFNTKREKVLGTVDSVFKYGFTRVISDNGEVYYKHQHGLVKV